MKWFTEMKILLFISLLLLLMIAGCNGKSFDYEIADEIPPGPGVFTGENGSWTIFDSEARKQQAAASEKTADRSTADTKEAAEPSEGASAGAVIDTDDEEFKQFQEWKKEQQEFEAFQKWKESKQGTKEYREFRQWQEWKAYKEWQENQKKSE